MTTLAVLFAHLALLGAPLAPAAPAPGGPQHGEAQNELRRREAQLGRLRKRLEDYEKELATLNARAPEPGTPADENVLVRCDTDADGRTVYAIEADNATLKAVLDGLAVTARTELILDKDVSFRALSSLVAVALDGVTLRDALNVLLGRFDLDHTIGAEGIIVSPPSKAPFETPEARLAHKAQLAYRGALVKYPSSADAPRAHCTLGQHLFEQGLHPQAIEQLRRLLQDYPGCEQAPAALYTLARSCAAIGDHANSDAAYRRLVVEHPGCAQADDALLALARRSEAGGRPKEAIPLLEEIARRYADGDARPEAEVRLAECFIATGRYDEAIERLERLLRSGLPEAGERRIALLLGRTLLAQGRFTKARAAFLHLKGRFPDTPEGAEAYYLIADAFFQEEQFLSALEACRGALAQHPASAHAEMGRMRLGELYRRIALHDLAIAAYEKVLADHPDSARRRAVLAALGECYWQKGNYQKAQLHFERAAADSRDDMAWRAWCRAGQCSLADRRAADAAVILERVVGHAPDKALVAEACDALGDCYRHLGRLDDALMAYRSAAKARAAAQPAKQPDGAAAKETARAGADAPPAPDKGKPTS